MATATKTPRLLAAAKEFNIGKETLVEFLTGKGFEINASNPNTKITEVMYDALQTEFAQDKLAKRKSEEIALPKGSNLDNKVKKEASEASTIKTDELPPIPNKEIVQLKPEPIKAPEPKVAAKVEIDLKEVKEEKAIEVEKVVDVKKVEPKQDKVSTEQPKTAESSSTEIIVEKAEGKKTENKKTEVEKVAHEEVKAATPSSIDEEHIEVKAPKLEGPNILGKINLDEMNLSSRPKKSTTKKTEEQEKTTKKAPKKVEQKQVDSKPKETTEAPKTSKPKPTQSAPPPVAEAPKPIVKTPEPIPSEEDIKPEHIEMKAPKLEGPKIIGRIELPVANTNNDSKEKRNRKRIPVSKKPETAKSSDQNGGGQRRDGQQSGGGQRRDGQSGGQNRPGQGGGQNRAGQGGQQGGGQNRGGQQGQGGGQNRGGQQGQGRFDRNNRGGDRRGGDRNAPQTQQQQEIDAKAIQEKIRQTQAKLAGNTKGKNQKSKYRRNKRDEMAERRAAEEHSTGKTIQLTEFISVSELASLLDVNFAEVIGKCMGLGIMVSINQRLDAEVIELVAGEFGYEVEFINLEQEADSEEEIVDDESELLPRAPIVTIMGHVDHGKTSLLDYIRNANVVSGEAGGITQHIGAYQVSNAEGKKITFLDTPGHEAFTAMRARGAKVADVAVIVVAADDAIMPQTKEAISHAQAANLPMIFAINKIDKEGANPEKIKEQLANMNILVEDWGGKFQSQEISAKKGINIDLLLEKILLEAEILELKANPNRTGTGSVIEASLDKGRGYVATVLVQNGTLNQGEMVACGQHYGKIKAMFNERGQRVQSAGPSAPVQVLGLNGAPQAGEKFKVYEDENEAKEIANHRAQILREQGIRTRKHITLDEIGRRLALGNFKELAVIIKGDFDGSVEALSDSLQKLSTAEVAVNVVHKGVGQITESDVLLATASDAIILGFQVRPSMQASRLADQENIEIRTYSIIYDAIEEVKSAMEGLLEPKVERKTVANVEIRDVFKISGVGTIAGCYVLDGKIARNSKINIVRDGIVVYTGELSSLKRFKDDVKEVAAGYECGMAVKNYNDIRVGDILEAFEEVSVKRTL